MTVEKSVRVLEKAPATIQSTLDAFILFSRLLPPNLHLKAI